MKKFITLSGQVLRVIIPMIALGILINFSSCTKTETNKPAPTITVAPTTSSNVAGAVVAATAHVDAPEGGKTLTFLVNGAVNSTLPDVTLSGTAQDVPVSFTIPAAAVVGAVYDIAMQATDNKGQLSMAAFFTVTVSSVPAKTIVDVPTGNIITNTTWTKDKIWRLNGYVRVGKDTKPTSTTTCESPVIANAGTVLTIEAGTVIYGKTGTPGGTLIVQRGSSINAVGTAIAPIIFTSEKAPGFKKSGDWGGVVLCGRANNNVKAPTQSTSTCTDGIEELEGSYGGYHGGGSSSNDADNSGTLKYVRIEYAGYPINPNQEINGLTLGSVGSGTSLSYIQVTYANDDSFEWFGGTVNCDHLIAYKGIDDDFDTDNGFSGNVQFGLGIRDPLIADQSGSNGFESDNDANGSTNLPYTKAKFSNMTIIGGKATVGTGINGQFQNGAQIRRHSQIGIYNSIITGFPNGIYIDGNKPSALPQGSGGSVADANAGLITIRKNIIAGVDGWGGNGYGRVASADETTAIAAVTGTFPFAPNVEYNGSTTVPPRGRAAFAGDGTFASGVFGLASGAAEQTINSVNCILWLKSASGGTNDIISRWTDAGLTASIFDPLSSTPVLLPTNASLLSSGADFTGLSTPFVTVTYRGAFGSTDWTTSGGTWVNWNPQITDYSH